MKTIIYLKLKEGGQMLPTLLFNVVTKSSYTLMHYNIMYNIFVMHKEAQLEQPTGVAHLYTLYTVHSHIN